ncbi:type II secretion system F family protein [Nonomuraea sp. MCN248]|uniref:Type II secretion system F family protein n=1 Tax=Nonomuraea corallina TaxID=2989783 RepID=A0ABT4SHI8_9ACTN|nr:type II secretion system F family protein [Nonomuraea corallina]MDA0636674.1 type II secretion system F family protein [Nonomuraea corallina]
MLALASVLCTALSAYLWIPPSTPAHRLARLLPKRSFVHSTPASLDEQGGSHPSPSPVWLDGKAEARRQVSSRTVIPSLGVGVIVALLVGGLPGLLVALLVTPATAAVLHRREPPELRRDRDRIAADLPFAADLMSACLLAGRPITAATDIAATAISGPLGLRLAWVSAQLKLGADPEPTWNHLSRDPATAQLARAMIRAAQSGAPVADVLTRLADDAREASRAASAAAARSVGVKAVAPLGLCFLPAFVFLGIIPVIAGLASTIVLP